MAPDDTRTMIRRVFDAIGKGDMDTIDELFAEDYVEHDPMQGDIHGREAFKQFLQGWRAAFPDTQFEVSNIISDGDLAAWMVRFTGTNSGSLMGMPPTGKKVDVTGLNMGRINAEGKAVEHWTGNDVVQLLQQLGLMPQQQGASA